MAGFGGGRPDAAVLSATWFGNRRRSSGWDARFLDRRDESGIAYVYVNINLVLSL